MDLKDIVKVGFRAGTVFKDFILVASNFEPLFALEDAKTINQLTSLKCLELC